MHIARMNVKNIRPDGAARDRLSASPMTVSNEEIQANWILAKFIADTTDGILEVMPSDNG
jgi:hypothetical protein